MMMLKQYVNLYQIPQEYVPTLSVNRIFQIWLVLFIFFLTMGLYKQWEVADQKKMVSELKAKQKQVNLQLANQGKTLKEKIRKNNDQEKMNALDEEIAKSEIAIKQLQQEQAHQNYALSTYLENISQQQVEGTYLSHFHINNSGKFMSFEGVALQPELVPKMVQSWQKSQPLVKTNFNKLQIELEKGNSSKVKFNLKAQQ